LDDAVGREGEVSFFEYLGCRLSVDGVRPIAPLEDLVSAAAP